MESIAARQQIGRLMKPFLKQNYALIAGIGLPLALIVLFFLVGKASVMSVAAPQYDAVFAVNYSPHSRNYPYRIGIDDGQLTVRVRPPKKDDKPRNYREPIIYVFDHKALYAKKLDIDFGNVVDGRVSDPELEALNRRRINSDPVSPDGYVFEGNTRRNRGLFAGIFGSGNRNRAYHVLRKGNRTVPITGAKRIYSGHFIGWAVK